MNGLLVTCLYALAVVAGAVVVAGICAALATFLEYLARTSEPIREARQQDFEDECTVCLVDFTEGGQVRKLDCHHRFHVACIRQWRQTLERRFEDPTCPLCRAPFSARKKRRLKKRFATET